MQRTAHRATDSNPRGPTFRNGFRRAGFIAGLAIGLSGCLMETISVPPVEPQKVHLPGTGPTLEPGSAIEKEHRRLVASFGGEYRSPKVQALLGTISERLRLVSDRPSDQYRVIVLNSATVNAFALPNGYVYVTRGLLALANDTAEIASVVAHEIAHVTARHAMARAELESRSVLVSRVMAEVLDNPGAGQLMRDQSRVAFASFSRQQEIDADELGVRAIAKAGFEAHGATRFLIALDRSSRMREEIAGGGKDDKTDILATHPQTPERIAKALSVAREFGAPGIGEADRTKWLQALEGTTYGDDPMQGVVLGRQFLHPKLRFAMAAPEGFVLENTAQAVLGVTAGAQEAFRLDSTRVDAAKSLAALLAENPIESIGITDIRELQINQLPAATGIAKGQDWSFRVYLIRSGDVVYRLIFAAQNISAAQEQKFAEAANSFRKLTEDEIREVQPQRIRLVTARSGDRPEDLVANHMGGVSQALERFYVINGLGPGDMLQPGTAYKVIGS